METAEIGAIVPTSGRGVHGRLVRHDRPRCLTATGVPAELVAGERVGDDIRPQGHVQDDHVVQGRATGQPAGHPPYTFVSDTAPGQATGNVVHAFGGLWHDVITSGSPASGSSSGSGDGGPGY